MKYLIILLIGVSFLTLEGCDIPKEETETLEYNNFMIYSDLSSRLDKSPNDLMVINQLIDYFKSECVKPGVKVNDRSSINFSRVNFFKSKCQSAKIDIEEIKSLEEKQSFVNGSKSPNLSTAIADFKSSLECNYREKDNGGLDILSLIYNEINSGNHIKKPTSIIGESDTTVINYQNHLFIFTDGYLEFSKKEGNVEFYFGQPEIEKVRRHCIENKTSVKDAINSNLKFKLRPLKSENNKFVSLYVMETYDRGFNQQKGTLKYTGDLSDNNILKTLWEIWAEESEFKHFVWKQITKSASLPKDYISTLIVH